MNKLLAILLFAFFSATVLAQTTPQISTRSNIRFAKETARQAVDIEKNYPYDIAIRNAKNDTLNTANVFKKNGKPTVLLFWLTTCAPCRAEMAAISKKYEQWQEEADFNFYAISVDWPKNAQQFITRVEKSNWPFPAYHDFNREFGRIMPGNLNGLPQTFILDKNGNIAHHKKRYYFGAEDKLFELIKSLQ